MNPRSFWEHGFDRTSRSCDLMIVEVRNKLVSFWKTFDCSVWMFHLCSLISRRPLGGGVIKRKCLRSNKLRKHGNVIALLFLIPTKRNLEQRRRAIENNKQELRCQHEAMAKQSKNKLKRKDGRWLIFEYVSTNPFTQEGCDKRSIF